MSPLFVKDLNNSTAHIYHGVLNVNMRTNKINGELYKQHQHSMRMFILCLLFTGIVLIISNELIRKPPRVIEYRHIPRDLDTYIRESTQASVIFADMIEDATADKTIADPAATKTI